MAQKSDKLCYINDNLTLSQKNNKGAQNEHL